MKTLAAGLAMILAMSAAAFTQDGKEKEKKEKELSIALADVDTNGDGRASITEIRIAISKFSPPEAKKEGDGKKREGNREANKEGARREGGKAAPEASIALADLDTNKDKRATLKELQAALDLLTNKKDGDGKKEGK